MVHICERFDTGGIETLVCDLSNALKCKGVESHLLFLYGKNCNADSDRSGFARDALPLRMWRPARVDPRGLMRLRQALVRLRPHILHCHSYYASLAALVLRAARVQIPIVYTVHANIRSGMQLSDRVIHWVMQRCEQITAVSREAAASVETFRGRGMSPCVIPNGVDLSRIQVADSMTKAAVRSELGMQAGGKLILMVAALNRDKDHPTLLRAFSEVRQRIGNSQLWLAGEGPERDNLLRLCAELAIGRCVTFCGSRSDVNRLLAGVDVFVLSSHREGMPMSVLEACCAGVPVIASNVGGMKDLKDSGLEILLTPRSDVGALRNALLLAASAEFSASAKRQAERARQRFSIERTGEEYLELYRAVQAGSGREWAA